MKAEMTQERPAQTQGGRAMRYTDRYIRGAITRACNAYSDSPQFLNSDGTRSLSRDYEQAMAILDKIGWAEIARVLGSSGAPDFVFWHFHGDDLYSGISTETTHDAA